MTPTQKLKIDECGDWELNATMIHKDYFASREDLDNFLVPAYAVDRNKTRCSARETK